MTVPSWPSYVMFAVKRLLRAQERETLQQQEDRLLDLMIICEVMILLNEPWRKGEKVAMRMAKLQNDSSNLGRNRYLFKLAYKLRNDILHDGRFSAGICVIL